MKRKNIRKLVGALRYAGVVAMPLAVTIAGCGGDSTSPVVVDAGTPNVVSTWNEVASATINQPNATTGTAEERQSNYAFDLASVHVAIYDAVVAIAGGYQPYLVTPRAPADGASQEAAASAAAYGVLKALFPSRSAQYQASYDSTLAGIADSDGKAKGVAIGNEVASAIVAARANDGRTQSLPPFVGGTGPGQYRGPGTVGRTYSYVRPFVLASASAVRPAGPQALDSAAYAADVAETQSLGGTTSTARTPEQATSARFHSENPALFWPRNLRPFLMASRNLVDTARLGALLWVAHADASIGCFEAKYHYLFWRPTSAINFAETDGNPATTPDPSWTPFLPTPPHPEYPAAHGCASGSVAESLRRFYGTSKITFDFSSAASGSSHRYTSTDELLEDVKIARIAGGMHFRTAMNDGEKIGATVAGQAGDSRFLPR